MARFTSGMPRGPASWNPWSRSAVRSMETVVWRRTNSSTFPEISSASARQRSAWARSMTRSGTTRPSGIFMSMEFRRGREGKVPPRA